MGNQGAGGVRSGRVGSFSLLFFLAVQLASTPSQAAAQSNGGRLNGAPTPPSETPGKPSPADSLELAVAKADSVRATLDQPPGSYDGVRASDLVKAPFQLFGASLALVAYGAGAAYTIADKVLIGPARKARNRLADHGFSTYFGSFAQRSGPGVILRYQGLDPLFVEAGSSLRLYQHYAGGVDLGDDVDGARVAAQFERLTAPRFWGVGPDTPASDRTEYTQDVGTVAASGWWTPGEGHLELQAGVAYENSLAAIDDWSSDPLFDGEPFGLDVFGLNERTEYVHVGGTLSYDRRRQEPLQIRGYSLAGGWRYFDGVGETSSSFHHLSADARAFVPVSNRQLLALRVLVEDHVGVTGEGVPFTHLSELGGDYGLRGYSRWDPLESTCRHASLSIL